MARTQAPTAPAATAPPTPPPEPATEPARPSPVLAWPSEWPVPELPEPRRRARRGLPMAPVLAAGGNVTAMTATAAYTAGGPIAAAATGVVIAAGATAAVVRRRATVRRSVAVRSGRATLQRGGSGGRSGSIAGPSRGGSGSRRSGGGGRSGTGGGGATRTSGGARSGLLRSGGPSSSGKTRSDGGRSGSGLSGHGGGHRKQRGGGSLLNRGGATDKALRKQQRAADRAAVKAAKKAAKQTAKDTAAKTTSRGHGIKAAAARATRAAWNATRPHRGRATDATKRAARKTRGALWDGLCAATAGAWAGLRRWDRKAALDRLKNVWARRRKDRTKPIEPAPKTVAATARRPAGTTPPTQAGGTTMTGGGHHFVAPAMEMARIAASYQPTGMLQVGEDFAGLEEALRLHAEAMKATVENADANQPLDPRIVEIMRQIHGLQLKAAELAGELKPAFEQLHDVDLQRLRNPRKGVQGERMWDVSTNL